MSTFEKSSRQDLANAIAVIVIDPGYGRVMQRSEFGGSQSEWEANRLQFDGLIRELRQEILNNPSINQFVGDGGFHQHYYQIGPACQGPNVQLIEFAQNIQAVVQTIVLYADLGSLALSLKSWWLERTREPDGHPASSGGLVFTAPIVEGICVADVLHRHGESRVKRVQSNSRQEFYGDPDHPTGHERYSVTVSVSGDRHYIYSVGGNGCVYECFRLDSGAMTALDIPDELLSPSGLVPRTIKRAHRAELN